jgi:general secretion pathway protein J
MRLWPLHLKVRESDRNGGFTLVELLVAIGILALIATMGWFGLDVIIRARTNLQEMTEESKIHQITFSQMQLDCSLLVHANVVPGMQTVLTDDNKLMLIRYVDIDNEAPRLEVVEYQMRDGSLVRAVSNSTRDRSALLGYWNGMLIDSTAMSPTVLVSNIEKMSVRTWNSREGAWHQAGSNAPVSSGSWGRRPLRGFEGMNGIEINLLVNGQANPMSRIFFLGAG